MKICKYCGSEAKDSQTACDSCGAKEFINKCENCGKVFEGEFCSSCGVRAGQQAKRCPRCGTEYFTNACPDCGYIPQSVQPVANTYQNDYYPKKRRTWLWVLGWIFIFPVPLTILLTRRENNLNNAAKVAIIIVAWLAYISFAVMGSDSDDTVEQAQGGPVTVSQQQIEETEPETTIEIEQE
ncbi:MAG: hypothetical protein IJS17_06180 [Clostridia bacterium]|nr:hypothetical protein [Clostridia bacterium]